MVRDTTHPVVMQREHERSRLTAEGKRTDDGDRCKLVVIGETGGTWAFYLHGAIQLGVRVAKAEAVTIAQVILGDGAR